MCGGELLARGATCASGTGWRALDVRDGARAGRCGGRPGGRYDLPCDALVLSPPDTPPATLSRCCWTPECPWPPKPFAIGVRIEHAQAALSEAHLARRGSGCPRRTTSWPAICPRAAAPSPSASVPAGRWWPPPRRGAAGDQRNELPRPGRGQHQRRLPVGVSPADFGSEHPLAGVEFQRRWEAAAYTLGGGGFRARPRRGRLPGPAGPPRPWGASPPPTARRSPRRSWDRCLPATWPTPCGVPSPSSTASSAALPRGGRAHRRGAPLLLSGTHPPGARTFSPPSGAFTPCGEGAGYAGGITSAAVDGIRVAEAIASK